MYCENCGKKIPDGSQFCPECGAPVHHEKESLVSRARRGDNDAIQQLMNDYRGMVRYQARMYVKNEDDVNEIEQETFIQAFKNLNKLDDDKRFGGWLKTTAINTSKNYVTTAFRRKSVMFTDLDDANNDMVYDAADERIDHRPEVQMDETARQEIILKVLNDLPETQRMIIVMHYYDNLSFRDIAEQLDMPMSTVTGRAQMAKNSIKASVTEIQNRDGIKLYHLSPIAFFIWLLGVERTAPVKAEPPVIGRTVRMNPQKAAAKDQPHYGNVGKTVRTATKATAGKAAGTAFLATKAGKAVVAGAIAVAAVGGSAAGVQYHKHAETMRTETAVRNEKKVKKNSDKITDDLISKSIKDDKTDIVWIKKPGSMDIDDFEDFHSSTQYEEMGVMAVEHDGYSPTWINGNYSEYDGNAIIIKKNNLQGINNYEGKEMVRPSYTYIGTDGWTSTYVLTAEGDDSFNYYLDKDFNVEKEQSGIGGIQVTFETFVSGDEVIKHEVSPEPGAEDQNTALDEYSVSDSTIMPVIDGYQSGDADLNDVSGFKLLKSGSDPVDLPGGMTPTYYPETIRLIKSSKWDAVQSYEYNTCFVNGVIKLQDQDKKVHLWNVKTGKYISKQSFDDATFYEDGYIGVKKNDKWAFMDENGKVVTDYLFDKVSGLCEGKAYVTYQGKIGILDLKSSLEKTNTVKKPKQTETSDTKKNTGFSKIAGEYIFSSGHGAWDTTLKISSDGSFTGEYHDSDMGDTGSGYPNGSVNYADFSGKFKDMKKLDDKRYRITLDGELKYKNPIDTTEIKSGTLYQYTDAYGFEDTDTFTVVMPGYSMGDLNSDIQMWVSSITDSVDQQNNTTTKTLIINDANNETFVE